jgi:hypothetical protein
MFISSHFLWEKTMTRNVSRGALLLLMLTICAMPAGAAQKSSKTRPKGLRKPVVATPAVVGPECPAQETFGQGGFRAFIDPQTGELREGTPEEQRALSAGARAESSNAAEIPEMVVYPDGMVVVDLKGQFMQSVTMVRNPDGSFSTRCGPQSTAAPGPARATALEEK